MVVYAKRNSSRVYRYMHTIEYTMISCQMSVSYQVSLSYHVELDSSEIPRDIAWFDVSSTMVDIMCFSFRWLWEWLNNATAVIQLTCTESSSRRRHLVTKFATITSGSQKHYSERRVTYYYHIDAGFLKSCLLWIWLYWYPIIELVVTLTTWRCVSSRAKNRFSLNWLRPD